MKNENLIKYILNKFPEWNDRVELDENDIEAILKIEDDYWNIFEAKLPKDFDK